MKTISIFNCLLFITILLPVNYLISYIYEGITERLNANETYWLKHIYHQEKIPSKKNADDNSRFIWPNDANCSSHYVTFGKNLPISYLSSYPRSGNHWFRYILESATGYYTTSIYHDNRTEAMGFLGEMEPQNSKRTISIKTHNIIATNNSVLLIIRNPMKSIISIFSCKRSPNISGELFFELSKDKYDTAEFHKFYRKYLRKWKRFYSTYLSNIKNLHLICYENLLENPILEARKALKFLNIQPNEERMQCLSKHLEGTAHRNHSEFDPYTLEEKQYAASQLHEVNQLMVARNFTVPKSYKLFISKFTVN